MKILIIGVGNVGAHIAYLCLFNSRIREVFLYDIQKDMLSGKVLDLNHSATILGKEILFTSIENLKEVFADIVVITAGMPRRQGMSRFDLIDANVKILQEIIENLNRELFGESIFIIVSNPVDVLTYYFYKKAGLEREKIVGMAGVLDTGRFRYYLRKNLNEKIGGKELLVIGSHSKDMFCIYKNKKTFLVKKAIEETKTAGTTIVSYYKGGSAYFAPAMGVKVMLDSIIEEKKEIISAVAILKGEYGYRDIAFGVPLRLSKQGIDEIIELGLNSEGKIELENSIKGIKDSIAYLKEKALI